MLNRHTGYSIVQIQAIKYVKGQQEMSDHLDGLVLDHKTWEELTIEYDAPRGFGILTPGYDCEFLEDAIALDFCGSVGDWCAGYASGFEFDVEMIGINDVVDSSLEAILEDVRKEFDKQHHKDNQDGVTILTLWEHESWQDWDGEWESCTEYLGTFDIKRGRELIL